MVKIIEKQEKNPPLTIRYSRVVEALKRLVEQGEFTDIERVEITETSIIPEASESALFKVELRKNGKNGRIKFRCDNWRRNNLDEHSIEQIMERITEIDIKPSEERHYVQYNTTDSNFISTNYNSAI